MLGVLPMLLGRGRNGPAVALLGTTYLLSRRDDGAPNDAGIPPATSDGAAQGICRTVPGVRKGRVRAGGRISEQNALRIGCRAPTQESVRRDGELPDAYLQLTLPRFELPRRQSTSSVHFVGPLRSRSSGAASAVGAGAGRIAQGRSP